MHLLDYDNVLIYQTKRVDRTRHKIDSYFVNYPKEANFNRDDSLEKKINIISASFVEQLLSSKGLVTVIKEKIDQLKGKDLSKTICDTDNFIKVYVHLKDTLDGLIAQGANAQFPELAVQQSVVSDTLDNLYAVLRMLKRQNLKKNMATSQFAKDSSGHSVNSLETVLHGRSST